MNIEYFKNKRKTSEQKKEEQKKAKIPNDEKAGGNFTLDDIIKMSKMKEVPKMRVLNEFREYLNEKYGGVK